MAAPDRTSRRDREPGRSHRPVAELDPGRPAGPRPVGTVSLFGLVQLELPGTVPLDAGRYLDQGDSGTRVLAIELEGGPPPPRRRRRRPRRVEASPAPAAVPVTVVTVVFADRRMTPGEAGEWLRDSSSGDRVEALLGEALATLAGGLAAGAAATGRAVGEPPGAGDLLAARIGFGEGEQVYDGRWTEALELDVGARPRQRKHEQVVPAARIAAALAGREPVRACEIKAPRVRVDLDAGRLLTAAIDLGETVRATIAELEFALDDPDHERDLDRLERELPELLGLPARLLGEGLPPAGTAERADLEDRVETVLQVVERVLRRYRISNQ